MGRVQTIEKPAGKKLTIKIEKHTQGILADADGHQIPHSDKAF
jgi:hypothetical protein